MITVVVIIGATYLLVTFENNKIYPANSGLANLDH